MMKNPLLGFYVDLGSRNLILKLIPYWNSKLKTEVVKSVRDPRLVFSYLTDNGVVRIFSKFARLSSVFAFSISSLAAMRIRFCESALI